jgi:negative regulator of flagellin synthesis FlgM
MRVTGPARVDAPDPISKAEGAGPAAPVEANAAAPAPLLSAVLKPAMEVLKQLPEIDAARVEALRDALSRGEVPFDAGRLAALIARYHGGRG